jgi:hypothetical protein
VISASDTKEAADEHRQQPEDYQQMAQNRQPGTFRLEGDPDASSVHV